MSEEKTDAAPAEKPPRAKPPLIAILIGVNVLAAAGALGTLIYTKMVYKRPPITESEQRAKIAKKMEKPKLVGPPGSLEFKPTTVNLNPAQEGSGGQGKLHYATVGFTLNTVDQVAQQKLEEIRPILQDQLLGMIAKRNYQELTSVQGRYLLRIQIRDLANQLVKDALVSDVFFTNFVIQ